MQISRTYFNNVPSSIPFRPEWFSKRNKFRFSSILRTLIFKQVCVYQNSFKIFYQLLIFECSTLIIRIGVFYFNIMLPMMTPYREIIN